MLKPEATILPFVPPDSRRRPPLPPMQLGYVAQIGLIGLRVLLVLSAAMALFAAINAPHG